MRKLALALALLSTLAHGAGFFPYNTGSGTGGGGSSGACIAGAGLDSVICLGLGNAANGDYSTASGGLNNSVSTIYGTISGGQNNLIPNVSGSANGTIGAEQRHRRALLVAAMSKRGFRNYHREWWHFAYGAAGHAYDIPIGPGAGTTPSN